MRTIWQVGGGISGSLYDELLIRHGLALIGPGDPGKWSPDRKDEDYDGGWVRRFATEPQIGDVVLLRIGSDRVVAVGIIASEYQYLEQFDDVHGWDLQHARRVRWRVLPSPQVFPSRVFGGNPPRFSRVNAEEIIRFANEVMAVELDAWQNAPLPGLPPPEPSWDIPPKWLDGLIGLAQDGSRMIWQEGSFRGLPSEDEMLVHFVIPFFRGLSWPQELLAVKWDYIDLAVFGSLPRVPENCCLVVEAKRLGVGAESALKQGVAYAMKLHEGCDVLLTDGFRYRLYGAGEEFQPVGYANLLRLKARAASLLERLQYRRNATPASAAVNSGTT
jgi:hypothetical protein